jgi:carbamoylphosphate synthase large subunit
VLPLRENAIAACPRGLGLYPSPDAVAILRDKRRFADYVAAHGLTHLCPVNYTHVADIVLPCIVKHAYEHERAMVVREPAALDMLEGALPEDGALPQRFAFQEFIPGTTEYTTHAIVRHGRAVWTRSFTFEKEGDARVGVEFRTMAPFDPPRAVLDAIECLLRPLDYSGPCNMDYTLRPSGEVAVFEINPRFGGTLFLPQTRPILTEALSCLVAEARDFGSSAARRT